MLGKRFNMYMWGQLCDGASRFGCIQEMWKKQGSEGYMQYDSIYENLQNTNKIHNSISLYISN